MPAAGKPGSVMRPVEALIPYVRNARTHSDAQVAQIAGSIREFGFTNPVLVDGENGIIAGHGRVLAARKPPPHRMSPRSTAAFVGAQGKSRNESARPMVKTGGLPCGT
jgi:hypothetical protein